MGLIEIKIKGYRCKRCGHEWVPKGKDEPKVCPNCKSPYWNKERIHKLNKQVKVEDQRQEAKK